MWTAVVSGAFGVLVVLTTALINLGTRPTRRRRSIEHDLNLLTKLRELMPEAAAVGDLESKVDIDVWRYAVVDRDAYERKLVQRRSLRVQMKAVPAMVGVAVLLGLWVFVLPTAVVDRLDWTDTELGDSTRALLTGLTSTSGTSAALVLWSRWRRAASGEPQRSSRVRSDVRPT